MKNQDGDNPDNPDATLTVDISEVSALADLEGRESASPRSRMTPPPLPMEAISMAPAPPATASFVPPQPSVAPAPPPARSPLVYVAVLAGALVVAMGAGWFFSKRAAQSAAAAAAAAAPVATATASSSAGPATPAVITIPTVEMGNE